MKISSISKFLKESEDSPDFDKDFVKGSGIEITDEAIGEGNFTVYRIKPQSDLMDDFLEVCDYKNIFALMYTDKEFYVYADPKNLDKHIYYWAFSRKLYGDFVENAWNKGLARDSSGIAFGVFLMLGITDKAEDLANWYTSENYFDAETILDALLKASPSGFDKDVFVSSSWDTFSGFADDFDIRTNDQSCDIMSGSLPNGSQTLFRGQFYLE